MHSRDFGAEFGWSSADWQKPTHDDYRHNGKVCTGGIAFPKDADTARCSLTDNIQFENKKIEAPYSCDPTDNSKMCHIHFNTTDYVEG